VSPGRHALRVVADSAGRRTDVPRTRCVRSGGGPARDRRSLTQLGHSITDAYRSPLPAPRHDGTAVAGEVLYVDRFGTLVSNIPGEQVEPGVRIKVAGTEIGTLARTFGDVARGQLVALVGSGGTVEIAVRDGSAARLLGVGVGAEVRA
jgi:S-adenosylmethionine hydrolase